ncbi:hypothetical protein CONPUDRAFT_56310 [Coniophora puteana RWD-64-598 SS2]|uniref:50S ribosomal protein L35 n=1 Tax=Coniophora puteana (strain RWD-64-598) TaxID=741705 RepID=A0A5M3MPM7_CONPW|nr:uncharacterized protein CONPUDRAFT_56310 [Coniophora puteana RWD-64-598 SS2]EIW81073.1 hypothetical protein CONPUDRAFT_56310 [Coniophora puteana RWD-64-598 SS2]
MSFSCLVTRTLASARSFSTSAVASFPKLKSHSGTKKRWRSLPNGEFKRGRANHSHLNVSKRPAQKNRLGQTAYSTGAQTGNLRKLLPYGSG